LYFFNILDYSTSHAFENITTEVGIVAKSFSPRINEHGRSTAGATSVIPNEARNPESPSSGMPPRIWWDAPFGRLTA
jgi:hypothetical protein